MIELAPGLHRWIAYHEEWKQDVGCLALEAGRELVLIDPLVLDWKPVDALARGRDVHVLLTIYYHARSARDVVERYGARLWSTSAGRRRITNRAGKPSDGFEPGDPVPAGVQAFDADRGAGEVVFWLPEHRSLAAGDIFLGSPFRLCPPSWLSKGVKHENVKTALRPVLDLPVERVLVSHGEPILERGSEVLAEVLR
jgi:glyoxylase-like metal-dependent hydrolase (beta-lactamase superfamily II)